MENLPQDVLDHIKDYIIFKPKTKEELQEAVDLWCKDKDEALNKYGHISIWDTSLITDMSFLFYEKNKFNDNINNWNTSNVSNMDGMFAKAYEFNKPLNKWNTSQVTNMSNMFYTAESFNKPINNWNTSQVTDMSCMFFNTKR